MKQLKLILISALFISGCKKSTEEASLVPAKTLYVASGTCFSGNGITTFAGTASSRAVTKWNGNSGRFSDVLTDMNFSNTVSAATTPQAMIDLGSSILLLTENAATMSDRKIFKIDKSNPTNYQFYASDATAFTPIAAHITRSMALDADGGMLFSKSIAAERLNTIGVRVVKGGTNPWINPALATGNCFTAAATQIQQIAMMTPFTSTTQGKMIYIHTGVTAAVNRIGIIQRTGLTSGTAADCAGTNPAGGTTAVAHTNAPGLIGPVGLAATGASPTSMVYIPTPSSAPAVGKLIVSYSGSTTAATDNATNFNYGIVMWTVNETSDTVATLTSPIILYRDESIVWAPSAMAYDATTNSLYVAVGGSPGYINLTTLSNGYNIEKFTLDLTTPLLTRVAPNNQPFIIGNAYTKCISHMIIAD
ncbi:MAG: hypothetical protein H7061_02570 [Bdellovibrionaceae bacterium]|nr:hypothetical protein [Bdellovibrio sp.]